MFKGIRLLCVVVILVSLSACTTNKMLKNKYIGEKLHQAKPIYVTGSGHYWRLKHLNIKYGYDVNEEKDIITFEGTIKYNLSIDESKFKSETILAKIYEMELHWMFADENKRIIDVQTEILNPNTNIFDPIPFKVELPYNENYKYVFMNYLFRYAEDIG